LEAKGSVNELFTKLKQAAYNKASYQASVHNANSPDTLNPLKADEDDNKHTQLVIVYRRNMKHQ
jgi:hypothetical protein